MSSWKKIFFRLALLIILLFSAVLFPVCKPPEQPPQPEESPQPSVTEEPPQPEESPQPSITEEPPLDPPGEYPVPVSLYFNFYPGGEITFYEPFALFTTQVMIRALDTELGFFNISLEYDSDLLHFESVFSRQALVEAVDTSGILQISSGDIAIGPGNNLELCRITWKVEATCFSDLTLKTDALETADGLTIAQPPDYTATIKVVERIGSFFLEGPTSIEEGAAFRKVLKLDTDEKTVCEYDIELFYDPRKVIPDESFEDAGIICGADGFIDNISAMQSSIRITGILPEGTGPGTDLEFLSSNWVALDTGRTYISLRIHKMVTLDNVYIKPSVRGGSVSIYIDDNSPEVVVWLDPDTVSVPVDTPFVTRILINTQTYQLAGYGMDVLYDPDILELDLSQANGNGIEAGNDGFISAYNANDPGVIQVTGFDLNSREPNPEMELLLVYWNPIAAAAATEIVLEVRDLVDIRSRELQRILSYNCTVSVTE